LAISAEKTTSPLLSQSEPITKYILLPPCVTIKEIPEKPLKHSL
jgi:hypothetical protein